MALFFSVVYVLAMSNDCTGPFPGWLSGPSMKHNTTALLPLGKGRVLCCFGIKGAWPSGDHGPVVLRFRTIKSYDVPIAVVTERAQCPMSKVQTNTVSPVTKREPPQFCEPFLGKGCSLTLGQPSFGCKARHGFPAVMGHGGCSSQIASNEGWVHAKCCAGEFGHVGTRVIKAKPKEPHLSIAIFDTTVDCLKSTCPIPANSKQTPCRCTFPSHICSKAGPDHCVEMPKQWSLNRDASCTLQGSYFTSIEACIEACNLDIDCLGIVVDKASLRICRLFNKDQCQDPAYSPRSRTHLLTNRQTLKKHQTHPRIIAQNVVFTMVFGFVLLILVGTSLFYVL